MGVRCSGFLCYFLGLGVIGGVDFGMVYFGFFGL